MSQFILWGFKSSAHVVAIPAPNSIDYCIGNDISFSATSEGRRAFDCNIHRPDDYREGRAHHLGFQEDVIDARMTAL